MLGKITNLVSLISDGEVVFERSDRNYARVVHVYAREYKLPVTYFHLEHLDERIIYFKKLYGGKDYRGLILAPEILVPSKAYYNFTHIDIRKISWSTTKKILSIMESERSKDMATYLSDFYFSKLVE